MKIKTELQNLCEADIYSLMLFALYKADNIPEMSALSQLSYILDKDNLLKFCEYYGGLTIKVPTIKELETMLHALLMFQLLDVEKRTDEQVRSELSKIEVDFDAVESRYIQLKGLLKDYNFVSGRNKDNV